METLKFMLYLFPYFAIAVILICVIVIAAIQVKRFSFELHDRKEEALFEDAFKEAFEEKEETYTKNIDSTERDLLYHVQMLLYKNNLLRETRMVNTAEDLGYHLIYMNRLGKTDWSKYANWYFSDVEIFDNGEGHVTAIVSMTGDSKGYDKNGVHVGEELQRKSVFLCALEGGQKEVLETNLKELINDLNTHFVREHRIQRHDFLFEHDLEDSQLKFVADILDQMFVVKHSDDPAFLPITDTSKEQQENEGLTATAIPVTDTPTTIDDSNESPITTH